MKAIVAYEKDKADKAAADADKRLKSTQKRAKKRQEGTLEVIKMAVQELLAAQTPPLQYCDELHEVVSRTFKPSTHDCKKFMQVG